MNTPFACILTALAFALLPTRLAAEEVDFNQQIRPILSDNCFLCHGPASSTRKADLRLDLRESAIDAGAIAPGDVEQSELLARITSEDADVVMPPPDSNKQLTEGQKTLLKEWIAAGAPYEKHWSFVPPRKEADIGSAHPVDHFIGRRLQAAGLSFSPPAEPTTLLRRVTLDLTGLPPTPAEVRAFVQDVQARGIDTAYDAVVDRLLASSAYGERMALAWLDAARYGDTSVMHADGPRDMWPWRDWVIAAYNANKPFDEFTVEQLAGDLLPDATVDQKVASGFNRNHATSDEGGAFAEELRVEYVVDRVQTTSKVWLGLTMECAQCHDHKYDPISQREYYQFFAYFNNTQDPGMQTRDGNQSPIVAVVDEKQQRRLADLDAMIADADQSLQNHIAAAEPAFQAWVQRASAEAAQGDGAGTELAGLTHWFPLERFQEDQLADEAGGGAARLEKGKLETGGREGLASLKLDGATQFLCDDQAPELEFDHPFTFAAWIKPSKNAGGAVFSRMDVGNSHRGWDLWMQGGAIGVHLIHQWPSNAVKVVSKPTLKADQWQHVVVSYDGGGKAVGVQIYIDGTLAENTVEADSLTATLKTDTAFRIGSRSQGANWKGEVDEIRIYDRALTTEEVPLAKDDVIGPLVAIPSEQRTEKQTEALRNYYFASQDAEHQQRTAALTQLRKQRQDVASIKITSMIMNDNPPDKTRVTYVLERGQYDAPKKDEAVSPGVPAALPPLPAEAPANRLGLARWLTSTDHPLTARVAINRYWSMLFGRGLVRSVSDFGSQGSPPSHPQLLDWLAVDFMESGWDVKRMIKLLVTSRTYRQSSRQEPGHLQEDPENLLLAHSPRFRLQGEFVRDQALAISGLLVEQVGGPSVKPYQPANIWNEVSLNGGLRYAPDGGGKLYRKSLYTYWKRSAPMPNMLIFDAPSREKCVVQRARTNTPLQALVTLNDPQFVEAARALAERLIHNEASASGRIRLAYQLAAARDAEANEIAVIQRILDIQHARFQQAPEQATEFLAVGQSPRDSTIAPAEHAAWAVVAQMILNLDETLTRN